jgi:putative ABC transport system substrate-binding protein
VASGFVASFARPGENVTGIFVDLPELAGKEIQLLREAISALTRLPLLWDERQGDAHLRAAQGVAKTTGTALFPIAIRTDADLDNAVERAMLSRPQALPFGAGDLCAPHHDRRERDSQSPADGKHPT